MIRRSVTALSAYVPGEQPSSSDIVKLNTNENPYPPSPRVAAALAGLDASTLRRYPPPSAARLRAQLATLHECSPEAVFVGNGSDEVLALCTRAFVENDGSIGYFVPSYSLYPVLADIRDVPQKPVPLGPEYTWSLPASYDCSLFFLTMPNAPTGMVYAREDVAVFCRRTSGIVVIDEAYVDFADGDCLDLALSLPNVLVARSLSKSYSLAGLRVGYAVGAPALIEALDKVKDSYNTDRIAQALALAAVEDAAYMRDVAERVKQTRERVAAALSALGLHVYPSQANFLWVRPTAVAAKDLFEELRRRRILIRYFPGESTGDCVRITVGTDAEMDRMLAELKGILS